MTPVSTYPANLQNHLNSIDEDISFSAIEWDGEDSFFTSVETEELSNHSGTPTRQDPVEDDLDYDKSELENTDSNGIFPERSVLPPPRTVGKWHSPLIMKGTKRIRFSDRDHGRHEGVIYIFRRESTGECYIGRTETKFSDRLTNHNSKINDPRQTCELYQTIRDNPHDFRLGVLALLNMEKQDSEVEEKIHIDRLTRLGYRVYNADPGGGGGYPLSKDAGFDPKTTTPEKLRNLSPGRTKMKTTPTRLYPLQSPGGSVGFQITPSGKRKRGVLYAVIENDEGEPKKYIGRTDRNFGIRSGEHSSKARCAKEESLPLYQKMKEHPDRFQIGILYERHPEDPPTHALEAYAIRKAKEKETLLYNLKEGGGGTTREESRSKRKKTNF